jgi:hypothetical protein
LFSSRAPDLTASLSAPLGIPNAISTLSASTSSGVAQPTSSIDPATLQAIRTLQARRQSSIIGAISSPKSIPAWYASIMVCLKRGLTRYRVSSLGADGKWPDNEVDYTTGCDARPANWPAEKRWQRIRMF